MTQSQPNKIVGIPIYDDSTLLDFCGATQVFAFARGFSPILIGKSLAPVMTTEGVSVVPSHTFVSHPRIDVLFVPGGGGAGVSHAMQDPELESFIKRAATTASWSGSVCTGAFVIAAAGLLDGCQATTYWSVLEVLNRFPNVTVDLDCYPRSKICPEQGRFSGGGVSSAIDLALELVELLGSKEIAEAADLAIQYAPDPPVKSGDPSQASPELVEKMRALQQTRFIQPISDATDLIVGRQD